MILEDEERDDISACTFETDKCHFSQCPPSPSSRDVRDHHPPLHQRPLRVVVDAIPLIPALQLDSLGSQQTATTSGGSCCGGASSPAEPTLPDCSFRSFTEPPLRRRRPRSPHNGEDLDASGHSGSGLQSSFEPVDTRHTASNSLQPLLSNVAPKPFLRSRFRTPRFGLLRPRRLHAVVAPFSQPSKSPATVRRRLIPAEHPLKVLWDFLTVLLSFVHAYATHQSIRDRQFGKNALIRFCELWFMVDILLNFFTERHVSGRRLTDCKAVWARYLTSWFAVDVLSLVPFEVLLVQPIIERQNRRGFFQKSFFRTKAVVRVSHIVLKNGYIPLFGKAARQTKPFGIGANRLLQLLIKYLPKYWLFLRNMKAIVAVRVLRQVHWLRKVYHNHWRLHSAGGPKLAVDGVVPTNNLDDDDPLRHEHGDGDDSSSSVDYSRDHRRRLCYNDWELAEDEREDDDDDDVLDDEDVEEQEEDDDGCTDVEEDDGDPY